MDRLDTLEKKFDEVQDPLKSMQEPGRSPQPIDTMSQHSKEININRNSSEPLGYLFQSSFSHSRQSCQKWQCWHHRILQ